MTRGNQRELARQKNMKKQSDSVKGKRRDDGLSAAARKQRTEPSLQSLLVFPYPHLQLKNQERTGATLSAGISSDSWVADLGVRLLSWDEDIMGAPLSQRLCQDIRMHVPLLSVQT
ncbi:small EDRK-rich factor 2 isoform X3 [Loxodonta africana]|uniref:small EDRK-rich factor 2 isoform X3 n=1 Tax=Loxodonta africana TaxID=9785 RepID=UPI0030D5EE4D